jgi:hypothetical protein
MMPFMGVRISWLTLATNWDFISAAARAVSARRFQRGFRFLLGGNVAHDGLDHRFTIQGHGVQRDLGRESGAVRPACRASGRRHGHSSTASRMWRSASR